MCKENLIPKISIITVSYNCVNDIEETINSVLSQDYPNLEYIIIDGNSTDGTVDLINKYKDKLGGFVSEPDKGVYDAMNKGLARATGDWVAFMNAGDRYYKTDVISNLFSSVFLNTRTKVIYGKTKYLYRDNTYDYHETPDTEKLSKIINKYQPYTHQAVFYNITQKSDCRYNIIYKIAADYDVACRYWNKYKKNKESFKYIPLTVCEYKAYDGLSSNPKNLRNIYKEKILIKIRNKMNVIEIFKDTIIYAKLMFK